MNFASKHYKSTYLIISMIVLLIYFGASMCGVISNKDEKKGQVIFGSDENYIGSQTCVSCHKEIYNAYILGHHYRTSAWIDSSNDKESYYHNDTMFYGDNLFVRVSKKADGIYQTAYSRGLIAASHRIDMVMGSGKKGQTFLTWSDSSLYQMPLSYSIELNKWINSPGYASDKVMFNRMIPVKCFECHSSYAEQKINEYGKTIFDSNRIVLSISCEVCHGPGVKHVQYHKQNPSDKKPAFIINTSLLSRQQQLDACASCHSGVRENIKPAFSFLPGYNVDDFFKPAYDNKKASSLDVHGNQYGLLTASKCFKQSVGLTCSSCHNVHQNESKKMEIFVQRCMNCHNDTNNNFCTVKNVEKAVLISNCINCHMPEKTTSQIIFKSKKDGKTNIVSESIRTHLIAVYKEQTIRYIRDSRN